MTRIIRLLALAAAVCACGRPPQETSVTTPSRPVWSAYRGGREVLRFQEGSGPLRSTALLPVGVRPPVHPFLTASALAPEEEGALRGVLEASKSFPDFMEKLKTAGFEVRPGTVSP